MSLRKKLIRLAYGNPKLRKDLLPLLNEKSSYSRQRRIEMNYGVRDEGNPNRPINKKRNWKDFIEPKLKQLVAKDRNNTLAKELLENPRKMTEKEVMFLVGELDKYGFFSPGFKVNGLALHTIK